MEFRGPTVLQTLTNRYMRVCVCYKRNLSKVDPHEFILFYFIFFIELLFVVLIPGTYNRWPVPLFCFANFLAFILT